MINGSAAHGEGRHEGADLIRRASSYDEILPLVSFCRAGRLFDVQEWIAASKPVNPPPLPSKGQRKRSPLDVAIDLGFHSMIQVLLNAGAAIEPDGWKGPMWHALQMRRLDIVQLLVEHGFDPKTVDMYEVFNTWDPEIMEFFIDHGADVEEGRPLAHALCDRIRTVLRIFKRFRERFPSFQEQANIALRHHCKEGNLKWVSLMLWAGADPYASGEDRYDAEPDPEEGGITALGIAALYRHYDIFKLRGIRLYPNHPAMREVLNYASGEAGTELATRLLALGLNPNDQGTGGCSVINHVLTSMSWYLDWNLRVVRKAIDAEETREKMKCLHLLIKGGAKWVPNADEIKAARQALVKLTPDYAVEFVWIMSKYQGCKLDTARDLLRTPTIKSHLSGHWQRIHEILSDWELDNDSTSVS